MAELCNLIFANLDKTKYDLKCEVMYSVLTGASHLPAGIVPKARADLIVFDKGIGTASSSPKFVIEVKRASAPKKTIQEDLIRLALLHKVSRSCRTMLFVISESARPKDYVSVTGVRLNRSKNPIYLESKQIGYYIIRRVAKAAHAVTKIERAQYSVILEVYSI